MADCKEAMSRVKRWIIIIYCLIGILIGSMCFQAIHFTMQNEAVRHNAVDVVRGGMIGIIIIAILFSVTIRLKNRQQEIEKIRIGFDEITSLPVKANHKMECQKYIDAGKSKYAYVAFDVNSFRTVNESYTYEYGNTVLEYIGSCIKKAIRKNESATRSSGDNFGMMLVFDDVDLLNMRLKYFFEEAERPPKAPNGSEVRLVFNAGVYILNGGEDINKVRSYANLARESGFKSFETVISYYDEALHKKLNDEREMEKDMCHAMDNGEFVVYLQPKFDIDSEHIVGAEALIRWKHSSKGVLSPASFVHLCEENGYIKIIDYYVLEVVCRYIRKWLDQGKEPVCISVNLSRLHILEADLTDKLCAITSKYHVPNHYIEFELTETVVLDEMDALLRTMQSLKKAGFSISMDDFGTGYSSLNLLRKIPVDVLKLDKEFLDSDDETSGRDKQIISHVIAMAKDLDIAVLAEGVETREQLDFLRETNCDMIQGFYYAKPMPIDEFENRGFDASRTERE